jgi:transcriptional regulator GlxA family with amidase domain
MHAHRLNDSIDVQTLPSALPDSKLAQAAIAFVLENFSEEVTLDDLAEAAGMTRFNFCRRFQKECGISPIRWLWSFRAILAAEFIALGPEWPLTDVAFACGFTSSAHFSRAFKQMYRTSPSAFRKAQKSQRKPSPSLELMFTGNAPVVARAATAALLAN